MVDPQNAKFYLIRNMVENSMFHLLQDDYIPMPERSRKKKTNAGESKRRRYTYTERESERQRGRNVFQHTIAIITLQ